jgi:NAD(P)-dependent dehydrogenase (short-subunit alcohol dehydrogenase family)
MSNPRLHNKTAIITGGASGMGLAAARLFIAEGCRVLIVDRDEASLQKASKDIASERLLTCVADLRVAKDIADYSRLALDRFGRIDAAIFNAGICGMNTPLEQYPEELFDEVLAVNLKAVWLGMRAVVPSMKAQKSGSIVFTSSIQGLSALPGTTAYTTSKHALVGMMKGAALELAPFNVRVNTVHPGYVATPMMDSIHKAVMPDAPEKFEAAIAQTVPMKRYAKAEELAKLMLYLASDESSYSTGSCFSADGGILAALP